jgi:hypothetical protein
MTRVIVLVERVQEIGCTPDIEVLEGRTMPGPFESDSNEISASVAATMSP